MTWCIVLTWNGWAWWDLFLIRRRLSKCIPQMPPKTLRTTNISIPPLHFRGKCYTFSCTALFWLLCLYCRYTCSIYPHMTTHSCCQVNICWKETTALVKCHHLWSIYCSYIYALQPLSGSLTSAWWHCGQFDKCLQVFSLISSFFSWS